MILIFLLVFENVPALIDLQLGRSPRRRKILHKINACSENSLQRRIYEGKFSCNKRVRTRHSVHPKLKHIITNGADKKVNALQRSSISTVPTW